MLPSWFDEPEVAPPTRTEHEECLCRFHGDTADASVCPVHGKTREPAVKLAEATNEPCPF